MFLLSFKGKRGGLDRKARKRGGKARKRGHVQNVNAYHSRLKGWVGKFRGVATCYLGRFRALDREHGNGPKPPQWLAMAFGGTA
jgi:hypothetical protein